MNGQHVPQDMSYMNNVVHGAVKGGLYGAGIVGGVSSLAAIIATVICAKKAKMSLGKTALAATIAGVPSAIYGGVAGAVPGAAIGGSYNALQDPAKVSQG